MHTKQRRFSLACVLLAAPMLACAPSEEADRVRRLPLKEPSAVLNAELWTLTSLRELSDGRLLLTERRRRRVVLVDFASGSVAQVGRRGSGPGEYDSAPLVFPLGGDSSLVMVRGQRRWLVLVGSNVAATVASDHPAMIASQGGEGADSLGHVLARGEPATRDGVTRVSVADSAELLLVNRHTGASEVIARTRRRPTSTVVQRDRDGEVLRVSGDIVGVMPSEEQALLFPDGAVAVARLDPFRVDWRMPDGRWQLGDSLPLSPVPVDERQRQWYMGLQAGNDSAREPQAVSQWPRFIPPFTPAAGALVPTGDGELLIRRSRDADHADITRYLLVDRRGRLRAEIELPRNARVLGSGRNALYVATTGEEGFEKLTRHPWP